jgi:hypothetical protein
MGASTDKKPGKTRSKYQPAHGRDFDITMVRELDHYETSRTRDRVSYLVLGCVIGAVGLAAIYGMITGSFGGLRNVWDAGGPIVGGIIGYYFHRSRKDSG